VILGVVGQDRETLAQYVARSPLPFPLLTDSDRSVMQSYDVFNALSWDAFRIAHPSAFIVDPDGIIRYAYVASNQADWPQTKLLAGELARLRAERG
jgi:peroxiredoxin